MACEECQRKDARIAELLASMVRLANVTPYPEEIKGWTDQRAKLIAEVGTLKAEVEELKRTAGSPLVPDANSDRIVGKLIAATIPPAVKAVILADGAPAVRALNAATAGFAAGVRDEVIASLWAR